MKGTKVVQVGTGREIYAGNPEMPQRDAQQMSNATLGRSGGERISRHCGDVNYTYTDVSIRYPFYRHEVGQPPEACWGYPTNDYTVSIQIELPLSLNFQSLDSASRATPERTRTLYCQAATTSGPSPRDRPHNCQRDPRNLCKSMQIDANLCRHGGIPRL